MVNKITTPPTQNEVIDKINELVDGKQDTITSSNKLSASLVSGLATVATTGSYNDLSNKPTIPTVNNATLTIQKNGSNVATFTANASNNVTANISVPTVDQTYSATSANAQSGVAVASAIGNGSVTINQGGTPRGTFTMNQNSNLTIDLDGTSGVSAIAILNKNTASPYQTLGIWQGTESQWTNGELKTWYYWKTVDNISLQNSNLPSSTYWQSVAYGNGRFVAISRSNNKSAYSTDGGETWTGSNLYSSVGWQSVAYGNDRFVAVCSGSSGKSSVYSTNGGETWKLSNLTSGSWQSVAYGNGRFVTTAYSGGTSAYSTDGGETWQSIALPVSGGYYSVAYGDGRFVTIEWNGDASAYLTDGSTMWQSGGNLPSSGSWQSVAYGNGRFVATSYQKTAYSTDGGETWQNGGDLPSSGSWQSLSYGNGVFSIVSSNGNQLAYSTDGGTTWQSGGNLPSSGSWSQVFGDNKFVIIKSRSTSAVIFTITYDKCYTDTANPATTSTVYSAPDTASSYTISSVTSGAITLSNNNTYYYNQSGNQYTYDTIGDAHPEYLCFIDGKGVKMGNTVIATNNSNNS